MDYGTGWLVSITGAWVPVAYNASVNETMPWRRASFTSLGGARRSAGRGRGPRSWEVRETVPYDWAQPLQALYISDDTVGEPLFWVPPMAAVSNYAPPLTSVKRRLWVREGASPGWDTNIPRGFDTDFFPVRPGQELEFGGYQDGGQLALRLYQKDFKTSAGSTTVAARNMFESVSKLYTPTDEQVAWGRLESSGTVEAAGDRFVRLATAQKFTGVDPKGAGGAWVTLDEVEISHGPTGTYNPLVTVSFTLTECERE